jgi:hypothetical protein
MIQSRASGKSISKFLFWSVGAVLLALAAWRRFSLPLDPLTDADTWGYLSPALHQLLDNHFAHCGRNYLYPGFLFLLLRFFGDLRAITIAQHLLGLIAGGLLLLTWQRTRAFVADSCRFIHTALGLILIAVFLFAGEPIRAEMGIRPEGVAAFFLCLNLYCTIEFSVRAFLAGPKHSVLAFGILTGVSAVVLACLKPSFLFVAALSLLPIGIFLIRQNPPRQKIDLVLGLVISAVGLLLPERFLSRDDDLAILFLPTTLFVVHADLIRDQMDDDAQLNANLPYSREWVQRMHEQLATEIAKAATKEPWRFPRLGFSPDYLMYEKDSIAEQLMREFNYDLPTLTSFYRFYYWRAWQHRTGAMLKKIASQMAVFYAPLCPAYDRRKTVPLSDGYRIGATSFNPPPYREVWQGYQPVVEFVRRSALLGERAVAIEQSRLLRMTLTFLAGAYLPLLAATLAVAAGCIRRQFGKRVGLLALLTLFLFGYNAAACLEVAIIHSMEVPRYSTIQFSFTLLSEILAIWLLFEVLHSCRASTLIDPVRPSHPDGDAG